jgi:RsiW-degrading membrane proteinase PrsW (M82 family)
MLNLFLAIIPGIAISVYIYYLDIHEKEPHRFLISCFIFGMMSTIPAIFMEEFGMNLGFKASSNILITAGFAFLVVALSEETVKFLFLRYYIYPNDELDEPMDGIVYAVMIGMGFATLENILYAINFNTDTMLVRMFTAVPAHAAFAIIMGYYVGLAKHSRKGKEKRLLSYGFLGAVGLHGTYDFFLFQQNFEALAFLAFAALGIGIYYSKLMIDYHQENSPHKKVEVNIPIEPPIENIEFSSSEDELENNSDS